MEINRTQKLWIIILSVITAVVVICIAVVAAVSGRQRDADLVTVYLNDVTQLENGETPMVILTERDGESPYTELTDDGALVGQSGVQYLGDIIPDYISIDEEEEMRAVWIGYMSEKFITAEKIDEMVKNCIASGANAIIFHVRAFGDAMYPSRYFPWSHVITDTQGKAPANGFDPLAYMVERCHASGIQIHAWVNPLRIQLSSTLPAELSADNPYVKYRTDDDRGNDCYVIDYNNGKFYNPGEEKVRQLLVNGMGEIVANYNVDGVHWDDYFYPAEDASFDDSVSYNNYLAQGGKLSLLDWRTQNINTLVRDTYNRVKAENSNCVFGISPAGNINNCLRMGADVYEWCSKPGYIDYICPQIYWTFESTAAPFAERCKAWKDMIKTDGIKFYVGLALYKAGSDTDKGQWLKSDSIIADQIKYIRTDEVKADGFMLFSYDYLYADQTAGEMKNVRTLLGC